MSPRRAKGGDDPRGGWRPRRRGRRAADPEPSAEEQAAAEAGPTVEHTRGVFMISVAAELADMHPQTLRMYEARGLITPKRSPRNTRLYSHADVERLRRIQAMTIDEGLNLAGVETVLALEERLERMQAEVERMRRRADEMADEVDRVRKSVRAELVPYGAYDANDIVPSTAQRRSVRIPIERRRRNR